MAEVRKVLGQSYPGAGALTDLYTVPDDKQVTTSSVTVCNQGTQRTTFRLSVSRLGEADASKHYVFYDTPVDGNRTYIATIGMTLAETDVIRCQSGNGQVSFVVFGSEGSA